VSKQVLEDCRCFTIAPQAEGFTIAKYLEVAKESNLQKGLVGDRIRYWCLMIVDGPLVVILFGSFPDLVQVCANTTERGNHGIVWAT
jgi:hypothetical protein